MRVMRLMRVVTAMRGVRVVRADGESGEVGDCKRGGDLKTVVGVLRGEVGESGYSGGNGEGC